MQFTVWCPWLEGVTDFPYYSYLGVCHVYSFRVPYSILSFAPFGKSNDPAIDCDGVYFILHAQCDIRNRSLHYYLIDLRYCITSLSKHRGSRVHVNRSSPLLRLSSTNLEMWSDNSDLVVKKILTQLICVNDF